MTSGAAKGIRFSKFEVVDNKIASTLFTMKTINETSPYTGHKFGYPNLLQLSPRNTQLNYVFDGPLGFPTEFEHADWLKRKAYTFSIALTDEQVCAPDFLDLLTELCQAGKPINDFLNYTFEEYGEFPDRR